MALTSRLGKSTKRKESSTDQGGGRDIDSGKGSREDYDGKGTAMKRVGRGLSWRRLVWMDTRATRLLSIVLVVLNVIVAITMPAFRVDNNVEPLSSFQVWMKHAYDYRSQLPPSYQPPSSKQQRRKDRFPSVQDRVKLYMGRWYEPQLQGVPPSSPFGPHWHNRYESYEQSQQGRNPPWSPDRVPYEPLVNPLGMDPSKLYGCSQQRTVTEDMPSTKSSYAIDTACLDVNNKASGFQDTIRRSVLDTVSAALLHHHQQQQDSVSFSWTRIYRIVRYEGILGLWTELTHPLAAVNAPPAFLWHYGKGVTRASTLWNTGTPVFGRVRDEWAEQQSQKEENLLYCVQRTAHQPNCAVCGPRHSTLLWPLQRDVSRVTQVPQHDIPFAGKRNKLLWRGSAYPVVDEPTLGQLEPPLSGFAQRYDWWETGKTDFFIVVI